MHCRTMEERNGLPCFSLVQSCTGSDAHKLFCFCFFCHIAGPQFVGRAMETDPTLLRYASTITEQKKCWELLAEKFDRFQTLRNNTQQHPTTCNRMCTRTQHVTSNNLGSCQQCCVRLNGAKSLTGFKLCATTRNNIQQHATGCANGRNM